MPSLFSRCLASRSLRTLPIPVYWFALGGAVVGCSEPGPTAEEQARVLFAGMAELDASAPREVRIRALDHLQAQPLQEPELVTLRDTCVRAHRALLRAQGYQEKAQKLMSGEALEPAQGDEARDALRQAQQILIEAKGDLERCKRLSAPLALRYR